MRRTKSVLLVAAVWLSGSMAWGRAAPEHWVGTWAAAPMADAKSPAHFGVDGTMGTTLRQVVHVSLGGSGVRVVLTNEFGVDPLTITEAQIAVSAGSGGIVAGSSVALNFSGHASVVIPPGAMVVSDAAAIKVAAMSDVAVSLFVPEQKIGSVTYHSFANTTNYRSAGNAVTALTMVNATPFYSWEFLKAMDVKADGASAAVVAFGDSITDGAHSTRDMNARWPDVLARRLAMDKRTAKLGVLNEGIGGNRVLHDNTGPSALARFDRDVIAMDGVKYVVIMEAINDVGHAADPKNPYDVVSTDDLIAGYVQMTERAHAHGIKVYFATLTPYVGAGYQSAKGEEMRKTLNAWMRTNKLADGFLDFDKATSDPANPGVFLPADDSGDHLHPSDAGYKAMGDSVDLGLFLR